MKLQLKFKVRDEANNEKKVSKTFSPVNESAKDQDFIGFAQAYQSLIEAAYGMEVYLIKVDRVMGGADNE